MLAVSRELLDQASAAAAEQFGPIQLASDDMPFTWTDYYADQMGAELHRRLIAFEGLRNPAGLADWKLATQEIEHRFAARPDVESYRPINLDPGYLTEAKLVLASLKNFAHRVYLRDGVFAEVTMLYRDGGWSSLPWTFPDYGSGQYDVFLTRVRDALRREGGKGTPAQ
jgi:hypothetical protein